MSGHPPPAPRQREPRGVRAAWRTRAPAAALPGKGPQLSGRAPRTATRTPGRHPALHRRVPAGRLPVAGFTLLEIMVALSIVAVALGAAIHLVGAQTSALTHLRDRTLAHWVASNELVLAQARSTWTEPGAEHGVSRQAERDWPWRMSVHETPDPAVRRVEVVVTDPDQPERELTRLTGYLARARQPAAGGG